MFDKYYKGNKAGEDWIGNSLPHSTLPSNAAQDSDLHLTRLSPPPQPHLPQFFPEQEGSFLKGKSHHVIPLLQSLQGVPKAFRYQNA